jgi:hypothetical protein
VRPTWADLISPRPGRGRQACFSQRFLRSCVTAADGGRSPFAAPLPRSLPGGRDSLSLSLSLPWLAGRGPTALVALSLMVGGTSLAWRN